LDGNGTIDFQEFYTAAINHQKIVTKENLLAAFQTFDVNGDGKIDIHEFKDILPSSSAEK
jgi:Ca2+-binding EF-hand superfamily protein